MYRIVFILQTFFQVYFNNNMDSKSTPFITSITKVF